jgi:hypothetical protein
MLNSSSLEEVLLSWTPRLILTESLFMKGYQMHLSEYQILLGSQTNSARPKAYGSYGWVLLITHTAHTPQEVPRSRAN